MNNVISLETKINSQQIQQNKIYGSTLRASADSLYGKSAVQVYKGESIESAMARADVLFEAEKTFEQWHHNGRTITGDQFIIKRSDTGAKLGNVTGRYKAVQPIEIVSTWQQI